MNACGLPSPTSVPQVNVARRPFVIKSTRSVFLLLEILILELDILLLSIDVSASTQTARRITLLPEGCVRR